FEAWDSLLQPGCFWKYVSWGPHVCTNQIRPPLAPQSKHNTEAICHLLCPGCLNLTSTGHSKSHCTKEVPELSLVVKDKGEGYKKIKEVVLLLKKLKAWNDMKKVYASQQMRAGKGKMKNCRHIQCRGPYIMYNEDNSIKTFRNIPGIT
ncbi:60s ribosomal protein l4, partial [Lynx pardinus]